MRALILLLCLLSAQAWGANWYMAPTGAGAGTTDGTSLANACNGPGDASCQTLAAGDTVYMAGAFDADDIFSVPGTGTAAAPIVYECAAGTTLKGERVVNGATGFNAATGAYELTGHAWTLVSGEVYSHLYREVGTNALNWVREDGILLTPIQQWSSSEAAAAAALSRGQFTARSTGKTMYVRTTDGRSPDSHVITVNAMDVASATRGFITVAAGKNYNTIKNCGLTNGAHGEFAGVHSVNATGTVLDNVESSYSANGVSVDGGSMTVTGGKYNYSYDAGLSAWGSTATLTNLTVTGAEFNDSCFTGWYTGQTLSYSQDCDGIGIGEAGGTVSNVSIVGNKFYRNGPRVLAVPSGYSGGLAVGGGISVSTSFAMTVVNLSIQANDFADNFRIAAQLNGGAGTDPITNVIFAGNTVRGTVSTDAIAACTSTPVGALRISDATSGVGTRTVTNNTFFGNSTCATMYFRNTTAGLVWKVQNNILASNDSDLFTTDDRSEIWFEAATANYTITNNNFYNSQHWDNDSGRDFYRILSTEYTAVQGTSDAILTATPFAGGETPTTAAGLKLPVGSALRRTGKDMNIGNYQDAGNRAFLHPPSIGAWEATSGDAATLRSVRQ